MRERPKAKPKRDDSKWRLFERLVAAIHHAESHGAAVVWDDKIKGRQFDVTIRFKYGLYNYLTVIECRDHGKPIPVVMVEAFVIKSRRSKADLAVMVSSNGYQEGSIEVAKDEKIELFTLTQLNKIPEEILSARFTPGLHLRNIVIHSSEPKCSIELPKENNILTYIVRNCLFQRDNMILNLDQIIESKLPQIMKYINENEQEFSFTTSPAYKTFIPYLEKYINASSVTFTCKIAPVKVIEKPTLDPFLLYKLHTSYEYNNVLSDHKTYFQIQDLELGFHTKLEMGKFYLAPRTGFYYYCRMIENEIVTLDLVESYQHGALLQAVGMKQEIKYQKNYIEVLDSKVIERLRNMLAKLPIPAE
jgi:hypothetical protein